MIGILACGPDIYVLASGRRFSLVPVVIVSIPAVVMVVVIVNFIDASSTVVSR
jgi:hypothetical protein